MGIRRRQCPQKQGDDQDERTQGPHVDFIGSDGGRG
jgi:hypothetical protein